MLWGRWKKRDWMCLKCGKFNHPDGEFCEFCGQSKYHVQENDIIKQRPVVRESLYYTCCPVCGAACETGGAFCSICGTSLKKNSNTKPTVPVQEIVPEPQSMETLVYCLHCGSKNDANNRYCVHCSEEIRVTEETAHEQNTDRDFGAVFCPECGVRFVNETTFCNECGTRIRIER